MCLIFVPSEPRMKASRAGFSISEEGVEELFEPPSEGVLCLCIPGGPEERENGGDVEIEGEENTGESPTPA